MPSSALKEISDQIENQNTDSFGKFYLYAALLNGLTVRKKKIFEETLPSFTPNTAKAVSKTLLASMPLSPIENPQLKVGKLEGTLLTQITNYQDKFNSPNLSVVSMLQKIFYFFLQRDQLNDLLFIIEEMNIHLKTTPMAEKAHNEFIFFQTSFDKRQEGVKQLLAVAEKTIKLARASIHNYMYGCATIAVAVVALHFVFSMGGLLLTLAMLAGAGYATYYFFQTAMNSYKGIAASAQNCIDIVKTMSEDQAVTIFQENNLNFIIRSIVAPIAYMGVAVSEHLAVTEKEVTDNEASRATLDKIYPEGSALSQAFSQMMK